MATIQYRRWCPPQSPLRIEFPQQLLHDIRKESAQPPRAAPLRWLPRFNRVVTQSSGLLFGVRHEDRELRNITYRVADGRFCIIDFEFATILDDGTGQVISLKPTLLP